MEAVTTRHAVVKAGCVTTEGDDLYYEVRGEGQPLLMIPGGGGDAGFYTLVSDILSDEYKVITYDRRGNSRSTRNEPQNFEISQQSRDAVAVLRATGETSAFVFGNSSGAIIALDMAKTQPQAIRAVIAHEPPTIRVLPDAATLQRKFAGLYWTAHRLNAMVAMQQFSRLTKIPWQTLSQIPDDFPERIDQNHEFFTKQEMLPSTNYLPDVETIRKNGVKVIMAAGQWTLDKKLFYGLTAPILAERLGCEMVTFPGHHVSYLDRPNEWSATLRDILHRTA